MAGHVTVEVPAAWRILLDKDRDTSIPLTCEVATVGEALRWVCATYPVWAPRLLREGRVPSWTNVFLGCDNIRDLSGLDTPVDGEVELFVLPALAGG